MAKLKEDLAVVNTKNWLVFARHSSDFQVNAVQLPIESQSGEIEVVLHICLQIGLSFFKPSLVDLCKC